MLVSNILVSPDRLTKRSEELPVKHQINPSVNQPSIQKDTLKHPQNLLKTFSKPIELIPSVTKEENSKGKIVFNRHIHTCDHSNKPKCITLKEIQKRYNKSDFISIENHGGFWNQNEMISSPSDPTLLPGAEISIKTVTGSHGKVSHHVGVIGVDEPEHKQLKIGGGDTAANLHKKVEKANGVVIFNHPEYPYINKESSEKALDYVIPYQDAANLDGVELFNDVGFRGGNVLNVLGWVERNFYERGLFPAILAG